MGVLIFAVCFGVSFFVVRALIQDRRERKELREFEDAAHVTFVGDKERELRETPTWLLGLTLVLSLAFVVLVVVLVNNT